MTTPYPGQWTYRWRDYLLHDKEPSFVNGKFIRRPALARLREDTPKDIKDEYERFVAASVS